MARGIRRRIEGAASIGDISCINDNRLSCNVKREVYFGNLVSCYVSLNLPTVPVLHCGSGVQNSQIPCWMRISTRHINEWNCIWRSSALSKWGVIYRLYFQLELARGHCQWWICVEYRFDITKCSAGFISRLLHYTGRWSRGGWIRHRKPTEDGPLSCRTGNRSLHPFFNALNDGSIWAGFPCAERTCRLREVALLQRHQFDTVEIPTKTHRAWDERCL